MVRMWLGALALAAGLAGPAAAQGVYSWGYNGNGAGGVGYAGASLLSPTPVPSLQGGVTAIETGYAHGLAIVNGGVLTWGRNDFGQVGNNAPDYSGVYSPYASPVLTSNVTAVSGGFQHSLAIRNGAVYGWGNNQNGQVGDGTTVQRNTPVPLPALSTGVAAISAGGRYSLAIKNGGVWYWGENYSPTPTALTGLSGGVTAISAGNGGSVAIQNGGVRYFTNDNGAASLNNPTTYASLASDVSAARAGNGYYMALRQGVVYTWGSGYLGRLGNGSTADQPNPAPLTSLPANVVDIQAGDLTGYALTADHRLFAWGSNYFGEFGNGTTTNSLVPVEVFAPSGYRFESIAAQDGAHVHAVLVPVPEPGWLLLVGLVVVPLRRRHARRSAA